MRPDDAVRLGVSDIPTKQAADKNAGVVKTTTGIRPGPARAVAACD